MDKLTVTSKSNKRTVSRKKSRQAELKENDESVARSNAVQKDIFAFLALYFEKIALGL